jgi:hypothetical protein
LTCGRIKYGQKGDYMKQCKVCQKHLPIEKFGITYHVLKDGTKKSYYDSTCMVCRRKKHLENPEKRKIHKKGSSNWYKNNPEKGKEQRLRRYGITLKEYNELRKKQSYSCAVCEKNEKIVAQGRALTTDYALHVDHCHETKKIRGLLCTNCNTLLGKSYDDVKILKKAIEYLEKETL